MLNGMPNVLRNDVDGRGRDYSRKVFQPHTSLMVSHDLKDPHSLSIFINSSASEVVIIWFLSSILRIAMFHWC